MTIAEKQKKLHPHHLQNRLYHKYMDKAVVCHLVNGVKIKGTLQMYDHYSISIKVKGDEILIYKHAVAFLRPFNAELDRNSSSDA
jgi:host factor-I protein